jgi:hypothetical protein
MKLKFQYPQIVTLEHSLAHPLTIVCLLLFCTAQLLVVTETVWPAKPKVFAIWPLREKVCQPLTYAIIKTMNHALICSIFWFSGNTPTVPMSR